MELKSKTSAWTLLVAAISGFLASFILTYDKFKVLKDSGYTPSCNINTTLNCKSVMLSKQAEVFGFPNSLIGVATFAMMLVIAVALFLGVRFPKIFWQLVLVGTALAVIFCHWLAFQTTFIIGALCPYCMVAWFATLLVLSVASRELIEFKRERLTDEASISATETIQKWMVPFHLLWAVLLIGSAFLGV
ncbi:MAG: vitamin K epoxide reductase family protein [Actinomycetota bacterium]